MSHSLEQFRDAPQQVLFELLYEVVTDIRRILVSEGPNAALLSAIQSAIDERIPPPQPHDRLYALWYSVAERAADQPRLPV